MAPLQALVLGTALSVFGVVYLAIVCNTLSAVLTAITIVIYIFAYTPLKRTSTANTAVGAIPGAIPPMIGWAATTGALSLEPLLLFLIIFFWTPPHFWALALYKTDDYARAGIPMLPVVNGDASTRRQILLYTLILVPLAIVPWPLGYTGAIYGVTAAISGAIMLMLGWQVLRERRPAERASRNLFAFSILYLFLLFAVLLVDRGWGGLIARLAT